MKLNLSNLLKQGTNDTPANNVSPTAFSLSGLGNLQQNAVEENGPVATPFTNNSNTEPVEERAFTFTFTDNETYDLDDIIFKKRRDNADCPLIVNVQENNDDDAAVIEQITKLILSDYGIAYTNENYKTQISFVPLFEDVFTNYFNTYYPIFNKQRIKVNEGSISLVSVLEEIVTYHESLITGYVGEEARTYANSNSYNKPQVEWEYGTVYDNALDQDINSFLPDVVNLFSLKEVNGQVCITYDGIVIPNSGVVITSATGSGTDARIETSTKFVPYPIDLVNYPEFTPVRLVQFRKLVHNYFSASNFTITHVVVNNELEPDPTSEEEED